MATTEGTEVWTSAREDVSTELDNNGNTITVTPITLSEDTDEWGEYTRTEGESFETSAVTYDNDQLRRDYGNSMILNASESMMLVRYDTTINDNYVVTIDDIEYNVLSTQPLKASDVLLAQMIRVGVKQN